MSARKRVVVMLSGKGSNFAALLQQQAQCYSNAEFVHVISDNASAGGLLIAKQHAIAHSLILPSAYANRTDFDSAIAKKLQRLQPDCICLAGFMRILSADCVNLFAGKMLNIHPSLLPKFPGLHTHQRALAAKESQHGCSIHFVDATLDGGPLIAQSRCAITSDDTVLSLGAKVQQLEHQLYPQVLQWFLSGRLQLVNNTLLFDQELLQQPLISAV